MLNEISIFLNNPEIDIKPLRAILHPYVSNAVFHRTNDEIARERMNTIITLSRVLDDENMAKAIEALQFEIIKK